MTPEDQTFIITMVTLVLGFLSTTLVSVLAFLKTQQVAKDLTVVTAAAHRTSNAIQDVSSHVQDIKHATNGMKDQLVTAVALSEFARGRLEERTGETSPSADPNALVDQNGHTIQHGEQATP